jgi:RimJ/RimL family protein N-acetyltransferase
MRCLLTLALHGEKLRIKRVTTRSLLTDCRTFLSRDPITNVLTLGDLYPPLIRVSDLYCAVEDKMVIGVCSVYRALSLPSLAFAAPLEETKRTLIQNALCLIQDNFIALCPPDEASLLEEHSTLLGSFREDHMVTHSPKTVYNERFKARRVKKNELKLLDKFYAEHQAFAWNPIQFETGPYYCIKHNDTIVSAAGVHILTPQISQLGNIITDQAYRNRGYATACTSALATNLASKGRIVGLFVRVENASAINVYEKLGFRKARDMLFLTLRKNAPGCHLP